MNSYLDILLVVIFLLNFYALTTSRLGSIVRIVSAQGAIIGFMPLLAGHTGLASLLLVAPPVILKGVVIPKMLFRALRSAQIKREIEPIVGFAGSLILGAAGTGAAVFFSDRLPLAPQHAGNLIVPAALSTILVGFLLLTIRAKAISQVVGYLVMENGIFIFGLLLMDAMPFTVELGVLLDLFVAVFVMGIIINHINREFSSIDTQNLSRLRE